MQVLCLSETSIKTGDVSSSQAQLPIKDEGSCPWLQNRSYNFPEDLITYLVNSKGSRRSSPTQHITYPHLPKMYFLHILGETFITVSSIGIIAIFLGFQLHSTRLSLRKVKLQACVFVCSKGSVPLRRAAEENRSNEELSGHRYPREGQAQEGSTVGSGIKPISPRSYLRLQQGRAALVGATLEAWTSAFCSCSSRPRGSSERRWVFRNDALKTTSHWKLV